MIEINGISRTYPRGRTDVHALKDVSLRIDEGEFVVVVGPSGSGKSTLLHILGFLDRPDAGTYLFRGEDVTDLPDRERAVLRNRTAGFVFQSFHLLPRASAFENVRLPMIYRGRGKERAAVAARLEEVGLADRMDHRPGELSGGEQQRVAIARALANEPALLLADEPTGNLDSATGQEIVELLADLRRRGHTIVMVTHERKMAEVADRVVEMCDGRIVSDERLRSVAGAPKEEVAIGSTGDRGLAGIADHVRQAFRAVFAHKMRSFLSMLGVLVGVGAVIATVTVVRSAGLAIEDELSSLGSNMLVVSRLSSRSRTDAQRGKYSNCFTFEDVDALAALPSVRRASPVVRGRGQLEFGNRTWNTRVVGASEQYASMRGAPVVTGAFFSEQDVRTQAKVAVVGMTVVRELFENRNPVGCTIRINRTGFRVVGVFPSKGARGGLDLDDMVILPVTTAMHRVMGMRKATFVDVEAYDRAQLARMKVEVADLLARRHRLTEEQQRKELRISDMTEIQDLIRGIVASMSWLLGAMSGIALLVGGIGIMNIMLVSVTERTREIGLRKAVGASRRDILRQFLVEAVVMTFCGGAAGIALGMVAAARLCALAGWQADTSLVAIVASAAFCIAVGLACGLWPARQAARLDPIQALRYE